MSQNRTYPGRSQPGAAAQAAQAAQQRAPMPLERFCASPGRTDEDFQAIVAAPGFCVGVRGDETEIHALEFLAPRAEQKPANALAAEAVRQLHAYFANAGGVFGLPLRPSGTVFQRRVWQEIAKIPCHQTRTYGELAWALHSAPRAVGQACGANPFPLVVPCHRVLAADGGLGGFARQRGGFLLDVKRWLLAHEAA